MCTSVLTTENISAIVLTSSNSMAERCLIAAAYKKNIPVIAIQHGIGLGRLIDQRVPIHFAVFGEFHEKQLIKNGALPDYVHKVGPVIFDEVYKYKGSAKKKNQLRKVFIATAPIVEDNQSPKQEYFNRFEKILKEISSIQNILIVVKLHPRERQLKEYYRAIQKSGADVVFCNQHASREEFYKAIQDSDTFVNFGTTAALEAMIIERPVVTITMVDTQLLKPVAWLRYASILVQWNEDVRGAIERSLMDEKKLKRKRAKYVRYFCGKIDGKSYMRVAQLIEKLTHKAAENT